MQRRAAAAYVAFFVVIAVGSYGATAVAQPPDISIDADHELSEGQSVPLGGTTYEVTEVNASTQDPTANIEWTQDGGNESASVTEGTIVTLGGTDYIAHFEGDRLQLTTDQEAYQSEVQEIQEHDRVMHGLSVVAALSGITAILLAAMAYMPVRRD